MMLPKDIAALGLAIVGSFPRAWSKKASGAGFRSAKQTIFAHRK
jgi:hypothetical protein